LESDFSIIFDRVSPNDVDSTKVSMTDVINDNMVLTPNISNIISMIDMVLENYHKIVQFEATNRFQNRERVNFLEANIHMMDIMESATDTTTLQKQNFKMTEMRQIEMINEEQVKLNETVFGDMGDIIDILRSALPFGSLVISDDGVVIEEDSTGDPILLADMEITINFGGISDGMDLADFNMYVESGFSSPLAELLLMDKYDGTNVNTNLVPEIKNLIGEINGISYIGYDVEVEFAFGSDFSYNMYIYDLLNDTTLIEHFENQ